MAQAPLDVQSPARRASGRVTPYRSSRAGQLRRSWRAVRETDKIQDRCDIAARLRDQRQVLQLDSQLIRDLEQGAHAGTRQLAHAGEVNGQRQGAAAAHGEQLTDELIGSEDVDRPANDNETGIVGMAGLDVESLTRVRAMMG